MFDKAKIRQDLEIMHENLSCGMPVEEAVDLYVSNMEQVYHRGVVEGRKQVLDAVSVLTKEERK